MGQYRSRKTQCYTEVALLGHALGNPKRLELVELLCQGSKSVDALARAAQIDVKLASAHLRVLLQAGLVSVTQRGKYRDYAVIDPDVPILWATLRQTALRLRPALAASLPPSTSEPITLPMDDIAAISALAQGNQLTLIDVRPLEEYVTKHVPGARSMPIDELRHRLDEIDKTLPVVVYCRGPFCFYSTDAAALLGDRGFDVHTLSDGVAEWQQCGMALASGKQQATVTP